MRGPAKARTHKLTMAGGKGQVDSSSLLTGLLAIAEEVPRSVISTQQVTAQQHLAVFLQATTQKDHLSCLCLCLCRCGASRQESMCQDIHVHVSLAQPRPNPIHRKCGSTEEGTSRYLREQPASPQSSLQTSVPHHNTVLCVTELTSDQASLRYDRTARVNCRLFYITELPPASQRSICSPALSPSLPVARESVSPPPPCPTTTSNAFHSCVSWFVIVDL